MRVDDICRYPVKGLSADHVSEVALAVGRALPNDRRWAIAHAASKIDPAAPEWARKQEFLMLAKDEKLGQLGISFEDETNTLTITRKGKQVSRGRLDDVTGRMLLQTFLSGFLPEGPRGNPRIVEAPADQQFTDVPDPWVSLINLASVRDIERVARAPVDPLRFRGNFYIDGAPAWTESGWVGKVIEIGEAALEVVEPIERCAATNVDPATGAVDMNLPLTLRKGFGHIECGVYARVVRGGRIAKGDSARIA
ncbi:MOSC domain-containing protein [Marivibrio halodurans]|uniref:MOSC domain-containing protein n=1 Tax=Marivibrio halodurans TaxID=2039722 RepID=A0A8J7RXK2_9PROT|nr:MOSC domain-containing protein [Marivibrio halodurans]MBP5856400.1 MOSC domain-containing protein [Marivibrio halodurans]